MRGLFLRIMERPIVKRLLPLWLLAPFISIAMRKAIRGKSPVEIAQARAAALDAIGKIWRPCIEEEVGMGLDPMDKIMRFWETSYKRVFGDTLGMTEEDLRRVIEKEVALAQRKLKENGLDKIK